MANATLRVKVAGWDGEEKEVTIYKQNGRYKRSAICHALGLGSQSAFELMLVAKYRDGMSGQEISEWIEAKTGVPYGPRSVTRVVEKHMKPRGAKEAFNNAMDRGRVEWVYKSDKILRKRLNNKLRFAVLERDEWKCQLCGAGSEARVLEVDHIVPVSEGGEETMENLRTLCHECNIRKSQFYKEGKR
tara:strand:- start:8 stop:571 length:564 start_codon:yes stop_codon:yes gene_type:complete